MKICWPDLGSSHYAKDNQNQYAIKKHNIPYLIKKTKSPLTIPQIQPIVFIFETFRVWK